MIEDFLKKHGEYSNDKCFSQLTTIKMGGKIAHFLSVESLDDLKEVINYLKTNHFNFKIIGNGSNLICGADEYDGVVISLKKLNAYEIKGTDLYVEAGVMAPYLSSVVANHGLSGLEFANGIPGTIGGLLYMNAGAYKHSISEVVDSVLVLKSDEFVWLNKEDLDFAYRHSIFQEHPHWVILAANLHLEKGNCEEINELMSERLQRRKDTQPLNMPSAGSCFRNPDDVFAWKLIDDIGYRGYRQGGVEVSNKHSNFIVNVGGGTANDYLKIVYDIQDCVLKKHHIKLVMEVEKFNC